MGCLMSLFAKDKKNDSPKEPKVYSWDTKETIDPSQFTINGLEDDVALKEEGTIDGQQFIIQNCKDCHIYLMDYSDTITVENCKNCKFIIGPVQGSIFFRDCQECVCSVSCQQFRTRDCYRLDVFMLCLTQPVIESSTKIRVSPQQLSYKGYYEQCKKAGLSLYNNHWNDIHDFTPEFGSGAGNWTILPDDVEASTLFSYPPPATDENRGNYNVKLNNLQLSFDKNKSVAPVSSSRGPGVEKSDISCLVLVFHHQSADTVARDLMEKLGETLTLSQSFEVNLTHIKAKEVFEGKKDFVAAAENGPVIGLEFSGDDAGEMCARAATEIATGDVKLCLLTDGEEASKFHAVCDTRRDFKQAANSLH